MTEVLPGIIRYGFEEMKSKMITAFTTKQNIGSVKLLEKFGFQLSDSDNNSTEHVPGMLMFVLHNQQ